MKALVFKVVIAIILVLSFNGCTSERYNYQRLQRQAEEALLRKDYDKTGQIYSTIYDHEARRSTDGPNERIMWAYYRLGVVSELSGQLVMAKGYYWGDQIEEGFYKNDNRIKWLAWQGWQSIDRGNPARTLQEILDLERMVPPSSVQQELPIRQEAAQETQDEQYPERQRIIKEREKGEPTAIEPRTMTPPPPGAPAPFRVYR